MEDDLSELKGVGGAIAEKLRDAGYTDYISIATAPFAELAEAVEVKEGIAKKIIMAARDKANVGNFETGDVMLERELNISRITSGSTQLDSLLGNGFETRAITELYGEFGSGKTQVTFQLAVNAQLPVEEGGLDSEVALVDTENSFNANRIKQMAEAKGLDGVEVLKKVHVAAARNSDDQMLLVDKVNALSETHNIRLFIVDSVTSNFRYEYIGRGTLATRQQKLNTHLHALMEFAIENDAAVIVANQVQESPNILYGSPIRPIGGHILAHIVSYSISLRKARGTKRVARLVDSSHLPDREVVFQVTEKGVVD